MSRRRHNTPDDASTVTKEISTVTPLRRLTHRIASVALSAAAVGLVLGVVGASPALAVTPAPGWTLDNFATPTNFSPADNGDCLATINVPVPSCDAYRLIATNAGSQPTDGSTVTLADTLPAGLTVQRISLRWHGPGAQAAGLEHIDLGGFLCDTTLVQCIFPITVEPDDQLQMDIHLTVDDPGASGPLTNSATVSGGGAPDATATTHNQIASAVPPFGAVGLRASILGPDGRPETQAGAHPYAFTTRIDLANLFREAPEAGRGDTSVHDLRDAVVDLPLGFLGSALATPTCTLAQFGNSSGGAGNTSGCPDDTVVGHIDTEPSGTVDGAHSPIWNIDPERGVAAEFGFRDILNGSHVLYARVVPGPDGYVLQVTAPDNPQVQLQAIVTTFYGNPAARDGSGNTPVAMFTNPADCSGQPLTTTIHMDSWQNPGTYNPDGTIDLSNPAWASQTSTSPPVSGCNKLHFAPTISAKPTTTQADSPSGIDITLDVPQPTDPGTLATPPLRKAVVTLPAGLSVNPASANGLQGCSLSELGMSASGLPDTAEPTCPDASKLGTVDLQTPALPGTLHGSIYLANPFANPLDSLLAGYIVVDDPTTGVVVKIPGRISSDPSTGQITGSFDQNPQFPFSELTTNFFGGARAPLRTPATCDSDPSIPGDQPYTVTSELTPWSAPDSGPPATPSDSFQVTSGPNGSACANTPADQPNQPSFSAGTVSPVAGAFSPLVVNLRREDGSQQFSTVTLTPPPGLLAKLAGTPACADGALSAAASNTGAQEQANPSCPAASQIGTVVAGAGAGPAPYYASGKVYMAGPYKGAPLSLALVTPAVAGPFDLGTVVVRTALHVDPATTQITAVSDPIPDHLTVDGDGIPLDIRSAVVKLDKPNFSLNGTSCDPFSFSGQLTSTLGQAAPLSDRFQLGECGRLAFKPKLSLSLKGGAKRSKHPALTATLTYPKGAYANIAKASVALPHSEFLDQAHIKTICTRVQFAEGNVAGEKCPAGSVYGFARAITPLLDKPLEGPVYLRSSSHPLPDLVAALNGQIQVVLDGTIDSVNGGIRSRFEVVPDAPVSRFVLTMQGGKKGLLVNSTNLCKSTNRATVKLTGQNGKEYNTTPKVAAKCPKAKKAGKGKRR